LQTVALSAVSDNEVERINEYLYDDVMDEFVNLVR
jgi:hypothetical protein